MEGFWQAVSSAALGWLILMALLYITGAVIYALRIPERLWPGKFDIWFNSLHSSLNGIYIISLGGIVNFHIC
ncbi:unnamed protein product [Protopolystoma xenopodis]|uniref:Uncharacterized protein n=1 Tax=Protopolystoma xenopodis TaxID=117903 RepID=A0A448WXG0_9PLAT|nr:unnamed protein product [Protopolystoma xenopodis]